MSINSNRDKITGRFIGNQNEWIEKDGCLYCYCKGSLLFFTNAEYKPLFDGLSVSKLADGYAGIRINGNVIAVHRLLTNAKAEDIVDHINRNKKDNRITNLRLTNKSVNAFNCGIRKNNTSGHTGVWWRSDTGKWAAEIKVDYKKIHLGCFENLNDAIKAREIAENKYYGN